MIIETLGLCYHLHCFKVSVGQRACRPRCFAWRAHGFCEPLGCGCATNKLGAVICQSVLRQESQIACYYLVVIPESSYKSQSASPVLFVALICLGSYK